MADASAINGVALAGLSKVQGVSIAPGLTWLPLLSTDFVSTNPYNDVNSVVNNPLTIHASNGNITFDLAEPAVARDGLAEGATWRLGLQFSTTDWIGDGNMGIIYRITPIDNPGVTSQPMFCVAVCDASGDTLTATHQGGVGMAWKNATQVGEATVTANVGGAGAGNLVTFAGNTPSCLCPWVPAGPVGDETTIVPPVARLGTWDNVVRSDSATLVGSLPLDMTPFGVISGRLYALLFAGFDGTGAGTFTATFKFEYAYINVFPTGEWP